VTRGLLVACALAALAGPAAAGPKIQVLQSEGRADAKVRAKVDAGLLALARSGGEQAIPGDITFTEAAAAVGCKADDASCKDEILGMLSVDEVVVTTVTPKPGGFEIAVRRVARGSASREAISFIAFDRLDKLETIAPLFSARPPPPPPPSTAPPPMIGPRLPPPAAPPPRAITAAPPSPWAEIAPGAKGAPPSVTEPRPVPIAAAQDDPYASGRDDRPRPRRRLQLAGMVGGGAMLVAGLVFWGSAASVQSEIDAAPVGTKEQLRHLEDLEAQGDGYATAGNVFFVGGLVLGGISTYYFVKSGRRRASSARLVPTVWGDGAGLALAIGGAP
jgi:hypothetical protein